MIGAFFRSRAVSFSVLAACVAVALGSPGAVAALALASGAAAVIFASQLETDRVGQAALAIGAMVLGVLVPRLAGGEPSESDVGISSRTLLLVMPMVTVAAARSLVKNPVYGARVTLAAVLVAFTGAGRGMLGATYVVLFVIAILFGLLALRGEDPARPTIRQLRLPHAIGLGFIGVTSVITVLSLARVLPPLHDALIQRIIARWQANRTGFSDTMALGSLDGMLQSNDVVMRIRGPGRPPALVRGVVLVTYTGGFWSGSRSLPPREVVETAASPSDPTRYFEIEHASDPRRYFLPLGASDVFVSTRVYQRDRQEIYQPSTGFPAKRVWFVADEPTAHVPIEPMEEDFELPGSLSPTLQATLAGWNVLEQPDKERIRLIAEHLRSDYQYSLTFERGRSKDPIADFLTEQKRGHCEYFASAMVLLARAARVPARVVAGYRVEEQSPLGYWIVRERDAHSWAEVWIDGRWQTVDPTPSSGAADASRAETPFFSALADGLRTTWEAVDDWLGRRSPFELSLMLVGLFGVLILYRTLRGEKGAAARAAKPLDPPLPAFAELLRALEALGIARPPALTLGGLAAQVSSSEAVPGGARDQVASAILVYERLRYGGEGDAGAVEERLRAAARVIGGPPSR
ncbi:MAG: DUF3488 domain-containing protein [Polyangiaceae bacterium]|nr:DUF3488 domain-containing protein [Polyangiaceae bacterium]